MNSISLSFAENGWIQWAVIPLSLICVLSWACLVSQPHPIQPDVAPPRCTQLALHIDAAFSQRRAALESRPEEVYEAYVTKSH